MSEWNKEHTRLYSIRIVKTDPLNVALERAADYDGVTPVRYIKQSLVDRLTKDGFLTDYVILHEPGRRPNKP